MLSNCLIGGSKIRVIEVLKFDNESEIFSLYNFSEDDKHIICICCVTQNRVRSVEHTYPSVEHEKFENLGDRDKFGTQGHRPIFGHEYGDTP